MKQSDIDKEIEDLTKQAQLLELQRETLASLDVCMRVGHDCTLSKWVGDSETVQYVELTCKCCGAYCTPGENSPKVRGENNHRWMFIGGGFANQFVGDVYEIEDTEPVEAPEPYNFVNPPTHADGSSVTIREDPAPKPKYELREEYDDATGFSRVSMVPKEEKKDE
jgi:hypothetical protein